MNVAIIGGGIAGLTTAIALGRYRPDLKVSIYECSREMKPVGAGLALAANAVRAFEQLGLSQHLLEGGRVLERFQILDKRGRVITQTDHLAANAAFNTVSNFAIHRADLQRLLLDQLRDTPLHLGKLASNFASDGRKVVVEFDDATAIETDFVIATDGVHSMFRRRLLPKSQLRFAGYTCWRGVTEHIPMGFDPSMATETWAGGKRFGIVPLRDGQIYWFATVQSPMLADPQFAAYWKTDLLGTFGDLHAPVSELIAGTDDDRILWNDIVDFKPVDRFAFGNILLLGDAAHATTPNMGQGACQAIEGAVILGKTLQSHVDLRKGFKVFEEKRLPRTRFIVNRSWQLGKIGQIGNPVLAGIRDFLFRQIPVSANTRQVKTMLDVRFE